MIEYYSGTVFNTDAKAIVNTVNTVGVMAAGLALEMASIGIRSNSVNPGFVATNILSAGTISEEDLKKNVSAYPLGRFGKPEDIAFAIIYLLSDASSWVTGHTLVIDGGVILR